MLERVHDLGVGGESTNHEPPMCPTNRWFPASNAAPALGVSSHFDFRAIDRVNRVVVVIVASRADIDGMGVDNITVPFFRSIFVPCASRGSELELELGRFPPSASVMFVRSFLRARFPPALDVKDTGADARSGAANECFESESGWFKFTRHVVIRKTSFVRRVVVCRRPRYPKSHLQ